MSDYIFKNVRLKTHVGKTGKPILAVIGFLGRGNAGDEAIFQAIYETFCDEFDILAVVEEWGAYKGWWDWYPYNRIERIHQGNIHYFEKRIAGLIVGGGGLGIGFGGSQLLVSKIVGTPSAFAGTDHTHWLDNPDRNRSKASALYLSLFDYVSLRSAKGVFCAQQDGVVNVQYGTDWALRLKSSPLERKQPIALVTVREFPLNMLDPERHFSSIRTLLASIKKSGLQPVLLPISPEDERFAREFLGMLPYPIVALWHDIPALLQKIASSALMLSIGRLHSVIFPLLTRTPVAHVMPIFNDPVVQATELRKIYYICEDFALPFLDMDEAVKAVENQEIIFTDETVRMVAQAQTRLERCIDDLRRLFRRQPTEE